MIFNLWVPEIDFIDKLKKRKTMAHNNECKSLKGYFIYLDDHKKSLPVPAIHEIFDNFG